MKVEGDIVTWSMKNVEGYFWNSSMKLKFEIKVWSLMFEIWSWRVSLKLGMEVWSWSFQFEAKVWIWSLKWKFEIDVWSWNLNLNFKVAV